MAGGGETLSLADAQSVMHRIAFSKFPQLVYENLLKIRTEGILVGKFV